MAARAGLAALASALLVAACGGEAAAPAAAAARQLGAEAPRAARPPLRARGRHVVDSAGRRVFLACVNWYGAHLSQMAANGLNRQPLAKIVDTVAAFGFNCVRLPFSLDMLFGNHTRVPDPNVSLAANPELQGLTPLQIFDATVSALTDKGVMVVLNNHVSSSGWCCSLTDGEGLWYTEEYPEDMWLRGVRLMALRYRDNPLVVGFDLRNEIRPSLLGTPTWGSGDNASDWSMASVKGAQAVLDVNEGMLIIISGLYFSIFLCDVPRRPVHEIVPALNGRTIYTSHEYKWVNFHLVARAMVGSYFVTLALWWAGLWLLALAGWRLGSSPCLAHRDGRPRCEGVCRRAACCCWCSCRRCSCSRACGCRPGRVQRSVELLGAVALTAASLLMLGVTELFMDKCGLWHLLLSMSFLFSALLCCLFSLVLWMRLAVACVKWSQGQLDLPVLEVSTVQELSAHRPGAARDAQGREGQLAAGLRIEEPPVRVRRSRLHLAARSIYCLVFTVSLMLLGALGLLWMVYGRYDAFAGELDRRWGFLVQGAPLDGAEKATEAPVWVGEFGSDKDDLWWNHFMRYLGEREVAGWSYWSLNGQKTNGEIETFGLLMEDSATVRHPWKLKALQRLIRAGEPLRALPEEARRPAELLE